jgi:hypothetical protein
LCAAFQCYVIRAAATILQKPIADANMPRLGQTRRPEAMTLWTNLVGQKGARLYPAMIMHCVMGYTLPSLLTTLNAKNSQQLMQQAEARFNHNDDIKVCVT